MFHRGPRDGADLRAVPGGGAGRRSGCNAFAVAGDAPRNGLTANGGHAAQGVAGVEGEPAGAAAAGPGEQRDAAGAGGTFTSGRDPGAGGTFAGGRTGQPGHRRLQPAGSLRRQPINSSENNVYCLDFGEFSDVGRSSGRMVRALPHNI